MCVPRLVILWRRKALVGGKLFCYVKLVSFPEELGFDTGDHFWLTSRGCRPL